MSGRTGRLAGAALGLAAVSVVLAGPLGTGATASGTDDARARAAALAQRVRALQVQTEVATEAYDRTQAALATVVDATVTARTGADAAQATAAASRALAGEQARALYRAGGSLGLYAGLLGSGDVSALADQLQAAHRVSAQTHDTGTRASAAAATADARAAAATSAAEHQVQLQRRAADAAAAVTALLGEQTQALGAADQQVRDLAAADAAAAVAAQQAAFQARLQAETAAAGVPLVLGSVAGAPAGAQGRAVSAMAALVSGHPPYVWGGTGPTGYDCSGLVLTAYRAAGVGLPRTAAEQYLTGPHPALTALLPGDLLFWGPTAAGIHHVAMYAGGGLMWSTDHTGDVARLQPIWGEEFFGATRPAAGLA